MRARPVALVRVILLALLLTTLVVCLGAAATLEAAPANAGSPACVSTSASLLAPLAIHRAEWAAARESRGRDCFAFSVAISGDTAVVSAIDANVAYVFTRSGATWRQQAKLAPADGARGQFGRSVAISNDAAMVGAPARTSVPTMDSARPTSSRAAAAAGARRPS